jgi:GDP-4-dehydro-6-deoxy-D-mannose reductase
MKPLKILVTGASGAAGSYFVDFLKDFHSDETEVFGLTRWHSGASQKNLKHSQGFVKLIECDLMDFSSVTRALEFSNPDMIIHFASHANVRASFDTPISVVNNNTISTLNLLEGIRVLKLSPRVVLASTSEVYGNVNPEEVPLRESQIMRPASPYAASKAFQDLISGVYFDAFHIPIIRTRMFTYLNARRSDIFATAWAHQIVQIERGERDYLLHGNLESVRTMIDVRDAMNAYWAAFINCAPGEIYNIGGTESFRVGDVLESLIDMAEVPIMTKLDPELLRPNDVTLQIPDCQKFMAATGWRPTYSIQDSLAHLMEEIRSSYQ